MTTNNVTIIKEMLNKIFTSYKKDYDILKFVCDNNQYIKFYHHQECCEAVSIEDIEGDLEDLIGSPILQAEEVTKYGGDCYDYHETWTFYKFATIKGSVSVRWYGTSNGYYSESVNISTNLKTGDLHE